MPMTYQRRERFPAGTAEERIVREQRLRLFDGAMASAYNGSEEDGWSLITTWDLFGEPSEYRRSAEIVPLVPSRQEWARH